MFSIILLRSLQSSAKAYEYLGFIMEKDGNFRDALTNYEKAWRLTNSNNPNIGFKLALNYMRCKCYTDSIDTARLVLEKYPDFPRIRKDVLERARNALKN